jgi:hypothetical protein
MVCLLKIGITAGAMMLGASAHKKINIATRIKNNTSIPDNIKNNFINGNEDKIDKATGALLGLGVGTIVNKCILNKPKQLPEDKHKKNGGFIRKTMMGLGITACLGSVDIKIT